MISLCKNLASIYRVSDMAGIWQEELYYIFHTEPHTMWNYGAGASVELASILTFEQLSFRIQLQLWVTP